MFRIPFSVLLGLLSVGSGIRGEGPAPKHQLVTCPDQKLELCTSRPSRWGPGDPCGVSPGGVKNREARPLSPGLPRTRRGLSLCWESKRQAHSQMIGGLVAPTGRGVPQTFREGAAVPMGLAGAPRGEPREQAHQQAITSVLALQERV